MRQGALWRDGRTKNTGEAKRQCVFTVCMKTKCAPLCFHTKMHLWRYFFCKQNVQKPWTEPPYEACKMKKNQKSVSQGVCFVIFFVACLLFVCIWAGGTVQVSFSRSVFSDSVCDMSAVHIYLDRWDCLSQFLKERVLILCVACLSGQVGLFKLVSQGVCFDSVCGMSVWTGGTV